MDAMAAKRYALLVLCLLCLMLSCSSAMALHAPFYSNASVGENLTISVKNSTPVGSAQIQYKRVIAPQYKNVSMSAVEGRITATIPGEDLKEEGVYEYYIRTPNARFPREGGTITIPVTSRTTTLQEKALDFSRNQSEYSWSCRPYAENKTKAFSCVFANMHADEALRFAHAYKSTGDSTYRQITLNLTVTDYWHDGFLHDSYKELYCDRARDDYDCGTFDRAAQTINMTGSYRQGSVIYSFFKVGQLLHNESIFELAGKYANGSASDCDVWAGNYSCENRRGQGTLAHAYWKAYEMTGNTSYRDIAAELTSRALQMDPAPAIMKALAKGYAMTGNSTYRSAMLNNADALQDICTSSACDPARKADLITAFLSAYRQTESRKALHASTAELLSGGTAPCDPQDASYACDHSTQQGRLNTAYWEAHLGYPDVTRIGAPRLSTRPETLTNLTLSFYPVGIMKNLTLHYRTPGELAFTERDFKLWNADVLLNASVTEKEGLYAYYVAGADTRFPLAGNASFIISGEDEQIENISDMLRLNDPRKYCSPNADDFSCRLENHQGWLMQSLGRQYLAENTSQVRDAIRHKARGLANTLVDQNELKLSTCEYLVGDYSCQQTPEYKGGPSPPPLGPIRQGQIAGGFLELYRVTRNHTYAQHGRRYLEGTPDACDPWNSDFDCGGPDSRAALAKAYWSGFEIFGDQRYLRIAMNLTASMVDYGESNYTEAVAETLWHAYYLNASSTYRTAAENITSHVSRQCESDTECGVERLAKNMRLQWKALRYSGGEVGYVKAALDKSMLQPDIEEVDNCVPSRGDPSDDDFNCYYADQQGMMSSAYTLGSLNFWNQGNITYQVNISSTQGTTGYMNNLSVNCTITNTANRSDDNATLVLQAGGEDTFQVLNLSTNGSPRTDNTTVDFEDVKNDTSVSAEWTLRADKGGVSSLKCHAFPTEGTSRFTNSTTVTVDNLFDVLGFGMDNRTWLRQGIGTGTYSIRNTVNFNLAGVNVSLEPTGTLELINFSSAAVGTQGGDGHFYVSTLAANQSVSFNATYNASDIGDYGLFAKANTTYGGYTNTTQHIYSYGDNLYDLDMSMPDIATVRSVFNISLRVTNPRNFTLHNVSVLFNGYQNLALADSPEESIHFNATECNLSNGTPVIRTLSDGESETVTWSVYADTVPDDAQSPFSMDLDSEYPRIHQETANDSIDIGEEALHLNYTTNLPGAVDKGNTVQGIFTAYIHNHVQFNLSNVSLSLAADELNITLLDANNTLHHTHELNLSSAQTGSNTMTDVLESENGSQYNTSQNSLINLSFNMSSYNVSRTLENISVSLNHSDTDDAPEAEYSLFYQPLNDTRTHVCTFSGTPAYNSDVCHMDATVDQLGSRNFSQNSSVTFLLNVTPENVSSIEHISADYTTSHPSKIPLKSSTYEVLYNSTAPGEEVFIRWYVQDTIRSDTTLSLTSESAENAVGDESSFTISAKEEETGDTTTSSGGGGASGFVPQEPLTRYIIHNYSSYDLYTELANASDELQSRTGYTEDASVFRDKPIYNLTQQSIHCINISRNYSSENITRLDVYSMCNRTYHNYTLYEDIPKEIYNSTQSFTVSAPGILFEILERDPVLLFTIPQLEPGVRYTIRYRQLNQTNHVEDFPRPIVYGFPPPRNVSGENITQGNDTRVPQNETNTTVEESNESEQNATTPPDAPGSDPAANATVDMQQLYEQYRSFYLHYKGQINSFIIFLLVVVGVVLFFMKRWHEYLLQPFMQVRTLRRMFSRIGRWTLWITDELEYYWILLRLATRRLKETLHVARTKSPGSSVTTGGADTFFHSEMEAYFIIKQIEKDISEKRKDLMHKHYENLEAKMQQLQQHAPANSDTDEELLILKKLYKIIGIKTAYVDQFEEARRLKAERDKLAKQLSQGGSADTSASGIGEGQESLTRRISQLDAQLKRLRISLRAKDKVLGRHLQRLSYLKDRKEPSRVLDRKVKSTVKKEGRRSFLASLWDSRRKPQVSDYEAQLYFALQKVIYYMNQQDYESANNQLKEAISLNKEIEKSRSEWRPRERAFHDNLLYPLLLRLQNAMSRIEGESEENS